MSWQDNIRDKLRQWQAELDNLSVRARLLEMESKDEFDARLKQLRQRWNTLDADFEQWEDSAEMQWQSFQTQFEADLERLTQQLSIMRPVP